MRSLWLDRTLTPVTDPLPDKVDDLVVGAGITGLTAALLMARSGRSVAVVEARHVGAVATGNTTGKLSLLQGTKLSRMLRLQSQTVVEAYVGANREGQQWLLRFCSDHDVPVQTRDAITYAATESEVDTARQEHEAAQTVGLDVRWVDALDVPFPFHGGTLLPDQAQFDPMDVLDALVAELHAHGGTVHEGRRVVGVSKTGRPLATLDDESTVEAEHVILATGTPVLDRGLYFAKVEPMRSYALAFDTADVPDGMFLSAGSPVRSVRDAPTPDGRRLVVGGNGHPVGRTDSELEHLDNLREWTEQYFPGAVETHAWSAQDYRSHDGIPYVGHLPRGRGHIHLATGFDKWGMTNGVAAARNITARILGDEPSWAGPLGRRITRPAGAFNIVQTNAGVGVAAIRSIFDVNPLGVRSTPSEGEGVVGRSGIFPTAVSTVDGRTCAVSGTCTHLGGVLAWNDAEKSWDCPLHGSRFAPDGSVLEGPATQPLTKHED
ncbi:MAG TPA: FAD-dependent oxidoreductase [Ilumatobacteraceae bacterium]|nr:FAD-dependent oxidoreductase [Ilumatobacteraceae bacterium]